MDAYERGFLDKLAEQEKLGMLVPRNVQQQRDTQIKKLMDAGDHTKVRELRRKWSLMR